MIKLNSIKIFGKKYKIIRVKNLEDVNPSIDADKRTLIGAICYQDETIRLFDGLGEYDSIQTFLHEIVHGISTALQLNLNERVTDLLATGLTNILVDNKFVPYGKSKSSGKSS